MVIRVGQSDVAANSSTHFNITSTTLHSFAALKTPKNDRLIVLTVFRLDR